MNSRTRRTAVVVVVAIAVLGAATAWYLVGEAHRTGRLVGRLLSSRLGVPVTVDAAVVTASRLRLRGVTVGAGDDAPLTVRVSRVDADGGMLALVAPAGRRLSIVAVAPSVTLRAPRDASPARAPDVVPAALAAIFDWPGDVTLTLDDADVRLGDHGYRLDVSGDKTAGVATAVVRLGPPRGADAVTAELRAERVEGGAIKMRAQISGDPSRLVGRWPSALNTPTRLAATVDTHIASGAPVTAIGTATIGAVDATPAAVDFALRYDLGQQRLAVSRYSIVRDPDVRLEGDLDVTPLPTGLGVTGTARGQLAGSPLTGRATWELGSGRLEGEVSFASLDIARVGRRLGLGSVPASARNVSATVAGVLRGPRSTATLQARAERLRMAALAETAVGATLDARLEFAGGPDAIRLARVQGATFTLRRDSRTLATFSATSPADALWPLALQAQADDLAQLSAVVPGVTRLSGRGRFAGEAHDGQGLAVRGTVDTDVPQVELGLLTPFVMSGLRAHVPVRFGPAASALPGTLTVARVAGSGVTVTDLTGATELVDGRFVLRNIRYAHAGGRGTGWLDAAAEAGELRLRGRLDAEGVDVATLVAETGSQLGRVTGRLRYTLTMQYPASGGYVALLRASSQEGGEVNIDAIQRLLESAAVQADSSVVLHQTLENLRVFPYESLTAEVRISPRDARLDLSLVGRKRLGIFPAAVEAINLRNVPLGLLARTFARTSP